MYINFWYPVCTSDELKADEPYQSQILGLPFVAFRDTDGVARILANTCAHRGGSLANGSVKDGCVVCPYHGWRYGGDGKCKLVPSLGDDKVPARAKVDSYPTQERYGIVHAFLGDLPEEERPPLFEIEEYDHEDWRASQIMILNLNAYFERSMENGLDPSHNEFVHPAQGSPRMRINDMQELEMPWGTRFIAAGDDRETHDTNLKQLRGNPSDIEASSWTHGPNVLVTWIRFSETNEFHQYFFEQPIDADHTRIYFINMRNCMMDPKHDERIVTVNLNVTGEDIVILENLYPVRTPETNTKEILTPADRTLIRFREWLKDFENHGWRIDRQTLKENAGDIAYAIPCPDRRKSGNWVLDPIPLMPAADAVSTSRRPASKSA